MDGRINKHAYIPNGVGFFGPKGSGKTHFARALGEHYALKGGHFEEINLLGDTKKDIEHLQSKFAEAKIRFEESGKKKYTILFFDEIEQKLDKNEPNKKPVIGELLNLATCCNDNGIIFMSTVDDFNKLEPAIFRPGRTDLRIPISRVEDYDIPDRVNYFINKNKISARDYIDYQKIYEAIKTKKMQYKSSDIEKRLVDAIANYNVGNEKIGTYSIINALTKPGSCLAKKKVFNLQKIKIS